MKTYSPSDLRNFAVVGHASAGKTMLSEAMLACAGVIPRLGVIESGTTVSDYHASERQRQISTQTSLLHCEWQGRKFNLMDTPGYQDFVGETLGPLRVGDFALVVLHAVHGFGIGTERVWDYASQFGLPKIVVINAVDKPNADFDRVLEQARQHYGRHVFPLAIPVNAGPDFTQVLDVLRSELVTYATDGSGKYREEPATGDLAQRVKELHRELIEHIAESDDTLMGHFFEQGTLSEEEFRTGIHAAVQRELYIPVFCTCATRNVGVARLMDFIGKYGSSPVDRQQVVGADGDGKEALVALTDPQPTLYVFKTMAEEHFGELSFFRIYSGSVTPGDDLFNSDRRSNERVGQLFLLNGRDRTMVSELGPGDIGAVVKLRDTHTGNTLCSPKRVVVLPKVQYPKPNIHAALKSDAKGEEQKVAAGLAALHEEDPTFVHQFDSELRQTVISAQGDLHLEVVADRLRRRYGVHVILDEPRVPYRETIRAKAESRYRHKKQTGGAGQFAEVWIRIEPAPRDSGVEFTESLTGQNVDRSFVPSVEKGVRAATAEGILAGYRVVDVKVDFYDGKMHPVDSKDIAFQTAGYHAFKEAFAEAKPCLLEPIMNLEVRIPEEFVGRVMGDLSGRRGRVVGMEAEGALQVLKAQAPARELHRYATTLQALTGGHAMHAEEFSHYEQMPRELEEKVIKESAAARAERANGH
jgi:elongation factor G